MTWMTWVTSWNHIPIINITTVSQICWPLTWSENFMWELWNHIPMDNMNKTLAVHALVTLALCYLPGVNINLMMIMVIMIVMMAMMIMRK